MDGDKKSVRFSAENWPYLGNSEREPKILLITSGIRPFRRDKKIINLE